MYKYAEEVCKDFIIVIYNLRSGLTNIQLQSDCIIFNTYNIPICRSNIIK